MAVCLSACVPARLPACLPAWTPACLPALSAHGVDSMAVACYQPMLPAMAGHRLALNSDFDWAWCRPQGLGEVMRRLEKKVDAVASLLDQASMLPGPRRCCCRCCCSTGSCGLGMLQAAAQALAGSGHRRSLGTWGGRLPGAHSTGITASGRDAFLHACRRAVVACSQCCPRGLSAHVWMHAWARACVGAGCS